MSDTVRRMLVQAIASAKAGETTAARRYLERVLYHDADREQRLRAHLWLSRIASDPAERRGHLEEVLAADPTHAEAIRELGLLDGKLDRQDIVDADNLPSHTPEEPDALKPLGARRFVCPKCGGGIRFVPGATAVECSYCGHRETIVNALRVGALLEEKSFVLTLATAKGHQAPSGVRSTRCEGCQAQLVTSGEITTRCPYCGSPHVVEVETTATVLPEGVIAFSVNAGDAQRSFREWLDGTLDGIRERPTRVRTTRLRGLYLPLWTFDLMGEVGWRGLEADSRSIGGGGLLELRPGGIRSGWTGPTHAYAGPVEREGTHYVMKDDVPVPATHRVPYGLRDVYEAFDLAKAVPYDPRFLSDWPADLYDVAPGDASLVARQAALGEAKEKVRIQATARYGDLRDLQTYSKSLAVQSYKLLLVPVWLANYSYDAKTYAVVINGQTGGVFAERPPGLLRRAFRGLLGLGG